ncbi:unnamed protein product [Rhizoctonia solani]|uniref:Uncharacterized protein n=1 Tax=Rhizoctonia solani TaxID=456999 RepID=A0A8H3DIL0_9AGAM|nr:unnamed protein product [Rhizoctonia solani]
MINTIHARLARLEDAGEAAMDLVAHGTPAVMMGETAGAAGEEAIVAVAAEEEMVAEEEEEEDTSRNSTYS